VEAGSWQMMELCCFTRNKGGDDGQWLRRPIRTHPGERGQDGAGDHFLLSFRSF
jgi:hypothetical protein